MLTPEKIRLQIEKLTSNLIEHSLCDYYNFPAMCDLGDNIQEVSISAKGNLSYALKNLAYFDIYNELLRTKTYNLHMLDGALIHMLYRFHNRELKTHRLAFFPSPNLEEFQNNPEIYLEDEIYAEVVKRNIVPFPIRFDFDPEQVIDVEHPASHLTLGQYENCRIPVSAPLTPYHFISFLLRNFYHTAFAKYCDKLTPFNDCFPSSITDKEKTLIYIKISESEKQ